MREFNLLDEYPKLEKPRFVSNNKRTIINRIIATKRDKNFLMEIEITVTEVISMMVDGML